MHAPLRSQSPPDQSLHKTWRHPEGGQHYFDSARVGELIALYNATGEARAIDELLARCQPLVRSLIKCRQADRHVPADELANLVYIKLWKSARLYDPARGSPFSFVARVTHSVLCSAIGSVWQHADRFTELNAEAAESVFVHDGIEVATEMIERVRRETKTTAQEASEISAQRWFFESQAKAGFHLRRHKAADAATQVFALNPIRARTLYDQTILEARRVLLPAHRVPRVQPRRLYRTRIEAVIRFSAYLSEHDF
jgi:hypothetical protein